MPTIICIALFLIIYLFLRENHNHIEQKTIEHVSCNGCGEKVDTSLSFCPHCQEKLKEACEDCKKMTHVNWRYCPYCGTTKKNR